eukprot:TRINITY_DN19738_c0_g1_i2.p2 TRINITY_DN19738_c0_g1~~TRINITY_DN19738_c0_g1_i2.p2  ORF type:complete len:184 (-),score=41.44 TRINITY_DN19738_c0_g1_i2:150-701(-)
MCIRDRYQRRVHGKQQRNRKMIDFDVPEFTGMGMLNFNSDSQSDEDEQEIEDAVDQCESKVEQQSVRRKLEYDIDMTEPLENPGIFGFGEAQEFVTDLQEDIINVNPAFPPPKKEKTNTKIKIDLFKIHNEELSRKKQILEKRAQSPSSQVYDRLYAAGQHQKYKAQTGGGESSKAAQLQPQN